MKFDESIASILQLYSINEPKIKIKEKQLVNIMTISIGQLVPISLVIDKIFKIAFFENNIFIFVKKLLNDFWPDQKSSKET